MKAAKWLLERFCVRESLVGDLVEEYGCGRSAWWLWRETAVAIARAVAPDLRHHWVLALRAVATGWLLNLVWVQLLAWVMLRYPMDLRAFFVVFNPLWPALTGWVIARTHKAHQGAMVIAYAVSFVIYMVYKFWGLFMFYRETGAGAYLLFVLPRIFVFFLVVLACTLAGGFLHRPSRAQSR